MPVVKALVNGRSLMCLVDTGSGRTLVDARVVGGNLCASGRVFNGKRLSKARPFVTADGKTSSSGWNCRIAVGLQGHCFWVTGIVVDGLANLGVSCLLGCDVIDHMGGVTTRREADSRYSVRWGKSQPMECCGANRDRSQPKVQAVSHQPVGKVISCGVAPVEITDKDFVANFANGQWTVRWQWSSKEPEKLQTKIGEYQSTRRPQVRDKYNAEIQSWISKGWLVPWKGPVKGIIPLLAVVQPTKDKVRPVMDYRELNEFVECHTGDEAVAICAEKVRKWRQLGGEIRVVDLKSAYLQIHVAKELWQYQVVRYQGENFALTRLGFGLTSAPRIMSKVLTKVLSLDDDVRSGTDHYIDDIVVNESVVSAERVCHHLRHYGLEPKEPVSLDGGRLLGIALRRVGDGHLQMSRGAELPTSVVDGTTLTKRGVFSLCGRLVGHYPIAGWLRPHCSYLKRLCGGGAWDAPVDECVSKMAVELLRRVNKEDPVRGRWNVNPNGVVTVWTDASSLALGVVLEIDGSVVEDASWLRKKTDQMHINVAELEAVGRGINLAIAWGFKAFAIATDSRTVLSWLDDTVEARERVHTKSAAEMLIKRRLHVIKQVIIEYELEVKVQFVTTTENLADRLTRVMQKWLKYRDVVEDDEAPEVSAAIATGTSCEDAIWAAHLPHHFGVERTFYLVKQFRSDLSRDQVGRLLAGCEACQRIDPAARSENRVGHGELSVRGDWCRVAADVTHFGNELYLSMVDCGPSRFAIWRRLPSETATSIVAQLQQVVVERGPCEELLLDNSTAFRSAALSQFADMWGIRLRFRAAYAPSGNGIVERNHRTIKRIAARGGISPEEATYWYNVTPRQDGSELTVPSRRLYRYSWRIPYDVNVRTEAHEDSNQFTVGEEVWVKPAVPSCTKQWALGIVTGVVSRYVVNVDGMPRHVRDVRKRVRPDANGGWESDEEYYDAPAFVSTEAEEGIGLQVPVEAEQEPNTRGNEEVVEEEQVPTLRRSSRRRQPPQWLHDYVP